MQKKEEEKGEALQFPMSSSRGETGWSAQSRYAVHPNHSKCHAHRWIGV